MKFVKASLDEMTQKEKEAEKSLSAANFKTQEAEAERVKVVQKI